MALNAYLNLQVDGQDVIGLSSVTNVGGMDVSNAIEAHSFYNEISVAGRSSTGIIHGAITFVKRPDNASIHLHRALDQGMVISGNIIFFKPGSTGQQIVDHIWTIGGGRMVGIRTEMLNNIFPENNVAPVMERVSIGYNSLHIIDNITGAEFEYSSITQNR